MKRKSIEHYFGKPTAKDKDKGCAKHGDAACVVLTDDDPATPQPKGAKKQKLALSTGPSREKQQQSAPAAKAGNKSSLLALLADESLDKQALREVEERFSWLNDKNVRDKAGRRQGHPDYDERSVTVPEAAWKKFSESQKQYWRLKREYRDVVLFFKVGSFYELYCEDAALGHALLGWKLTLTGVGHCLQVGCPASGVEEAMDRLLAAGHKVARVEQMETAAEAKAARGPKATIRRELTRVQTPALALGGLGSAAAVHLLALHEAEAAAPPGPGVGAAPLQRRATLGFAFLDAAAGKVHVGAVTDDAERAALATVLVQVAPAEVLTPRGRLSPATLHALAAAPSAPRVSRVDPGAEFPDAEEALLDMPQELFGKLEVPDSVRGLPLGALAALAALHRHLQRMRADEELATAAQVLPFELWRGFLRLDGPTLANLELLEGSRGGPAGSLLARLDTCASPGGKRKLRQWLCQPLHDPAGIAGRAAAVAALQGRPGLVAAVRGRLRGAGDLERALGRARAAAAPPQPGLPTWALEASLARRLSALVAGAAAVRAALGICRCLADGGDEADPQGEPPPDASLLSEAAEAALAVQQNEDALAALGSVEEVIEQPEAAAAGAKQGGKGRKGAGARPGLRLREEALEEERQRCSGGGGGVKGQEEESGLEVATRLATELVTAFNAHTAAWDALADVCSTADVLASLAEFGSMADGPTCAAEFVAGEGRLEARGLWHPCAVAAPGTALVPNDLSLGGSREGDAARCLLLTGPNMGGKSTLLRAACLAVILAHMGCPVPAAACRLSLTDCIFTRLGARDNILAGESTFYVECAETAAVLRSATASSLVVLDELGRGTATHDGYAIAHAVLSRLVAGPAPPRLLFATHYHGLTANFAGDPRVRLGHMTALVTPTGAAAGDGEQGAGPSAADEHITFLYKLEEGACPRSYGLQVARLAAIPASVVQAAEAASQGLEHKLQAVFGTTQSREAPWRRALRQAVRCCRGTPAPAGVDLAAAVQQAATAVAVPA